MSHATPIALQLYTLRDACTQSVPGALEAAAGVGYDHVELFGGFWGLEPAELRRALDDLGLTAIAAHVALEQLESDLPQLLEDYEVIGCTTLVCPWLSEERRSAPDAFANVGRTLNRIGYRLKARGFRLAYHNHDFEYRTAAGTPRTPDGVLEVLGRASHDALGLEIDVFWLAYAGIDPADYLRRLGRRVHLVHLKDGRLNGPSFLPLGDGDIDIPAVIAASIEIGVGGFVVEQDDCDGDPVAAAGRSLDYLRSLPAFESVLEGSDF